MEEAKSQAAKEDKLIFVDIYTTWCGPCKTMSEKIFPQKEVGDYFNSNFINVKFDAERGEGIQVAKNYNVTAYPTFLILDKEGKEVGRVVGAKTPAEVFIKDVEKVREIKK
ncbi:MAG: thioredoxin family protein [Rikenellaceae bacterium]|nr:thioredoxin family protein [Rikenellaceae bacterium]